MPYIQFVNHASVLISNGNKGLLTDPWYSGNVFNKGWDLLVKNDENEINNLLEKVNYIWVSHEHPDHFSPSFFLNYRNKIIDRKIKIIFQKTKDKRVISFLKSKGFDVLELENNSYLQIESDFLVRVQNIDFYDSALIVDINGKRIINLNDCPFETEKELKKFSYKYGPADILLSQFGYAAWKGGRENKIWRENAAIEKLNILEKQATHLNCKKIIPFASFIYFSNKENEYLNIENNTPDSVKNFFKNRIETVFLKPLEIQKLDKLYQKEDSFIYWKDKFSKISKQSFSEYKNSHSIEDLKQAHRVYMKKLTTKNSLFIIKLLKSLNFLNIFADIRIFLTDLNETINISIINGITKTEIKDGYDASMHSESLMFIFKNEFGFDTLTVNGNFEANKSGFSKITKHLAIGSLNAMGLNLNPYLLFNFNVYLLLLKKLFRVSKKLEMY